MPSRIDAEDTHLACDPLVETRVYAAHPDRHIHGFHQILLGLGMDSELEMAGQLYRVQMGAGLIVPAGSQHDYHGHSGNCQIVLDLPVNSLAIPQALFRRPRCFALAKPTQAMLNTWARRLPVPGQYRQHHWQAAVQIVGELALQLSTAATGANDGARYFPTAQIERHLRRHLDQPLKVAELARQFGWGERRFHDLFCEAFGLAPHRYIARLRLDCAAHLLLASRRPIAELALASGHADQAALTRSFQRRFGQTPGAWREALTPS